VDEGAWLGSVAARVPGEACAADASALPQGRGGAGREVGLSSATRTIAIPPPGSFPAFSRGSPPPGVVPPRTPVD